MGTIRDREPEAGYPAEKARQGRIVLNTPTRRVIFFGGLVLFVVVAVVASILS
jgi:hypothetical protein